MFWTYNHVCGTKECVASCGVNCKGCVCGFSVFVCNCKVYFCTFRLTDPVFLHELYAFRPVKSIKIIIDTLVEAIKDASELYKAKASEEKAKEDDEKAKAKAEGADEAAPKKAPRSAASRRAPAKRIAKNADGEAVEKTAGNPEPAEKELPPILIMHGDEDGMVPFNQSVQIYEALKAAGKDAELYKVLGAGHGIEFFSGDVMEVVFSFLARNL